MIILSPKATRLFFCPDALKALRTGIGQTWPTAYRPVWVVPRSLVKNKRKSHSISNKWRLAPPQLLDVELCALPTWWFWRSGCTRSHSEHGRETLQRRWYFDLSHGRVGRCQVCKTQNSTYNRRRLRRPNKHDIDRQRPDNKTGRPQSGPLSLYQLSAEMQRDPNKGASLTRYLANAKPAAETQRTDDVVVARRSH